MQITSSNRSVPLPPPPPSNPGTLQSPTSERSSASTPPTGAASEPVETRGRDRTPPPEDSDRIRDRVEQLRARVQAARGSGSDAGDPPAGGLGVEERSGGGSTRPGLARIESASRALETPPEESGPEPARPSGTFRVGRGLDGAPSTPDTGGIDGAGAPPEREAPSSTSPEAASNGLQAAPDDGAPPERTGPTLGPAPSATGGLQPPPDAGTPPERTGPTLGPAPSATGGLQPPPDAGAPPERPGPSATGPASGSNGLAGLPDGDGPGRPGPSLAPAPSASSGAANAPGDSGRDRGVRELPDERPEVQRREAPGNPGAGRFERAISAFSEVTFSISNNAPGRSLDQVG